MISNTCKTGEFRTIKDTTRQRIGLHDYAKYNYYECTGIAPKENESQLRCFAGCSLVLFYYFIPTSSFL